MLSASHFIFRLTSAKKFSSEQEKRLVLEARDQERKARQRKRDLIAAANPDVAVMMGERARKYVEHVIEESDVFLAEHGPGPNRPLASVLPQLAAAGDAEQEWRGLESLATRSCSCAGPGVGGYPASWVWVCSEGVLGILLTTTFQNNLNAITSLWNPVDACSRGKNNVRNRVQSLDLDLV